MKHWYNQSRKMGKYAHIIMLMLNKSGIEEAKTETITNMLKDNIPLETISKYVNLPLKKVKQIVSSTVL